MLCWCVLQKGHSGDVCELASTLCRYYLRKGDIFVLSWERVRRARRRIVSPKLLKYGGGVRNIFVIASCV